LPHTGNDVVDLLDPANAGKGRDSRYRAKILTNAENEFVGKAPDSDKALWLFWAAKETAYKVVRKIRADVKYLPRRYEVHLAGGDLLKESVDGKVMIMGKEAVFVRFFSHFDYVHCIGTDNIKALDKICSGVAILPALTDPAEVDVSLAARRHLTAALADYCHVIPEALEIKRLKKNGILQPPGVYLAGKKMNIDVSLSHDGRFTAFAFL